MEGEKEGGRRSGREEEAGVVQGGEYKWDRKEEGREGGRGQQEEWEGGGGRWSVGERVQMG